MTDVACSTPVPDRPTEERVSDRGAVLAPWLLLGIGSHLIYQWHSIPTR